MAVKLGGMSRLHAFPRAQEHLMQKTPSGAIVTILGLLTMLILFIHELGFYLKPYQVHQMSVDQTQRSTKLDIVLNITFPGLPCQVTWFVMLPVLSLDALDMSGKHEVDLHTTIFKERLDVHGNRLGKELISDLVEGEHKADHEKPTQPANLERIGDWHMATLEETEAIAQSIKDALDNHEGCNVHGHLQVQRVAGNFHVSVHGQSFYVLQKVFTTLNEVNVSHVIHQLGFGHEYPGLINPLDGFVRILEGSSGGTFKYFLKVVPTQYRHLRGQTLSTNQYSVTEYFTATSVTDTNLPAVFFLYDLSPIVVSIEEKRRNFFHFVTRLCAVLGGTFALSGMMDRWVHQLMKHINGEVKVGRSRGGILTPSRIR